MNNNKFIGVITIYEDITNNRKFCAALDIIYRIKEISFQETRVFYITKKYTICQELTFSRFYCVRLAVNAP